MEPKISKAQLEVWEWKEKLYEEFKDMPLREAMQIMHDRTQPIIEEIYRKKREKVGKENDSSAAIQ
ncbi:hypothetical protein [Salmonirosea aquatica]|uniref:Uncharacterized protein n=1 Tax=Salmonirosea aquatica TaxID=2654236 RepID=A0A7C9F7C5_9BACT|nr:hypothetical protein [Cytophagaceae bacterium SJW1-29]